MWIKITAYKNQRFFDISLTNLTKIMYFKQITLIKNENI